MSTTLLGALLALGSALCWGGLDATRKQLAARVSPMALVVWMTAGQAVGMGLWFWLSSGHYGSLQYVLPGLACLLLNVLANVLFVLAVRVSPLSLTVPYLALSPAFAALAAIGLLAEYPSMLQWLGIAVVVVGAMALNAGEAQGLGQVLTAFVRERGSVYMTIVALLWALTVSLDKLALQHATPAAHALVQTGGVSLVSLAVLAVRRGLGELRLEPSVGRWLLLAIGLGGLAMGTQLVAVQWIMVGMVETVKRAVGLVMAVALGRFCFDEPVTASRVVAACAMALGTSLVILG